MKQTNLHSFLGSSTTQITSKNTHKSTPSPTNGTPTPGSTASPISESLVRSKQLREPPALKPAFDLVAATPGSSDSRSNKRKSNEITLSKYELARLERIRQNQEVLRSLGLLSTEDQPAISLRVKPKPSKKRKRASKSVITHRKTYRLRSSNTIVEKLDPTIPIQTEPAIDYEFDDSSVLRYQCDEEQRDKEAHLIRTEESQLKGWNFSQEVYTDGILSKVYSISFQCAWGSLIAAGGHGGRVCVFGRNQAKPLLSWKAHSGWISNVILAPQFPMTLLSSANDGRVILWDLSKSREEAGAVIPPIKTSTPSLHGKSGIFCMDCLGSQIVTAGKDARVCWSRVTETEIQPTRVIEEYSSVIKTVKFQKPEGNLIAFAGNDRDLVISDLRTETTKVSKIEDISRTAVNSIEWNPVQTNLLLTASFDPEIHLYDLRSLSQPVYTYQGHVDPSLSRLRTIYHPLFCNQGTQIVTPGNKSNLLSLYSVNTGTTVSRGDVGFESRSIAVNSNDELIAAHQKTLFLLFPNFTSKNNIQL